MVVENKRISREPTNPGTQQSHQLITPPASTSSPTPLALTPSATFWWWQQYCLPRSSCQQQGIDINLGGDSSNSLPPITTWQHRFWWWQQQYLLHCQQQGDNISFGVGKNNDSLETSRRWRQFAGGRNNASLPTVTSSDQMGHHRPHHRHHAGKWDTTDHVSDIIRESGTPATTSATSSEQVGHQQPRQQHHPSK